jgi:uncharacterized protein
MGKIAIWILVAVAVMLVLRMIAGHKRRADRTEAGSDADPAARGKSGRPGSRDEADSRGPGGELMMSCAVCGVHLPASDAVFARGKVYCGAEHRDADESRRDG